MRADDHNKGIPPAAIELERQQLAAIRAFEALVAQPSYDWALHQLREIGARVRDGEPADPWLHAIVALGKRNTLSANECLSMIDTVWDSATFGLAKNDPELHSINDRLIAMGPEKRDTDREPLTDEEIERKTLDDRWAERGGELLDTLLRAMDEGELADRMRHKRKGFATDYFDGLRAFKERWPERKRENDLASQRQNLTLARIPDTARRAYRQDVNRRFGFCLDDEDVVIAATMIEQALHFPDVSIERVLTRADRLARTVLARWSAETPIPNASAGGLDLDAVTALANAIEPKLPALSALMQGSIAKLFLRDAGKAHP